MAQETSWFHDLTTEESKEERATLAQRLIAGLGVVCLIVLVGLATNAQAMPVAEAASPEGARIVLHDEPCKIDLVTNLKKRTTWHEKGKVFEGCYEVHPGGFVLAFYADKTVAVIPLEVFHAVRGA